MGFINPIATDTNGNPMPTGSQKVLDKDDFLQLLVTKMQHQDPLKPMSDEGFIAQLAQFSTLELMNNIADGISDSNQWDLLQMQSLNNTMATGLIGKEIKASPEDYNGLILREEGDAIIALKLDESAANLSVRITDSSGVEVASFDVKGIPEGESILSWDGLDENGDRFEAGTYTVQLRATNAAGDVSFPTQLMIGRVDSIVYREGAAYLQVDGAEFPLGAIHGVGEPGSFTGDAIALINEEE